jgi:hypothetical protein
MIDTTNLLKLRGEIGNAIAKARLVIEDAVSHDARFVGEHEALLRDIEKSQQALDDELLIIEQINAGITPRKRDVYDIPALYMNARAHFYRKCVDLLSTSAADDALDTIERAFWCEMIDANDVVERLSAAFDATEIKALRQAYDHDFISPEDAAYRMIDHLRGRDGWEKAHA